MAAAWADREITTAEGRLQTARTSAYGDVLATLAGTRKPNATYFIAARREPSGITVGKPGGLRRSANKNAPNGPKVSGIARKPPLPRPFHGDDRRYHNGLVRGRRMRARTLTREPGRRAGRRLRGSQANHAAVGRPWRDRGPELGATGPVGRQPSPPRHPPLPATWFFPGSPPSPIDLSASLASSGFSQYYNNVLDQIRAIFTKKRQRG